MNKAKYTVSESHRGTAHALWLMVEILGATWSPETWIQCQRYWAQQPRNIPHHPWAMRNGLHRSEEFSFHINTLKHDCQNKILEDDDDKLIKMIENEIVILRNTKDGFIRKMNQLDMSIPEYWKSLKAAPLAWQLSTWSYRTPQISYMNDASKKDVFFSFQSENNSYFIFMSAFICRLFDAD